MEPVGVAFAALGTADLCLKSVTSSLSPDEYRTSYESAFRPHSTKSMGREYVPNRFYRIVIGNINVGVFANTEQIRK